MHVLVPTPITDANLISSTLLEPAADEQVWISTKAYEANEEVIVLSNHVKYRAVVANTGSDPIATNVFPAKWTPVGMSNKWAAFDEMQSSVSVGTNEIVYVLRPGPITAISFLNMDAGTLEVDVYAYPGGQVVKHVLMDLDASVIDDYWAYFFSPYKALRNVTIDGIEAWVQCEVRIKLSRPGTVKIGTIALGSLQFIGDTEYGATIELNDYSVNETDRYGNRTLNKRGFSKDIRCDVKREIDDVNGIVEMIANLMSIPCVWVGSLYGEYSALQTYGTGSASIVYNQYGEAAVSVTVRGLL